jgi:hypothetical protein
MKCAKSNARSALRRNHTGGTPAWIRSLATHVRVGRTHAPTLCYTDGQNHNVRSGGSGNRRLLQSWSRDISIDYVATYCQSRLATNVEPLYSLRRLDAIKSAVAAADSTVVNLENEARGVCVRTNHGNLFPWFEG